MATRWIRLTIATWALAAGLSLAGVAAAADSDVSISGFAFSPASVTVQVGDSVTWTNGDGVSHSATGTGWDTGTLAGGASGSVTFDTAGSYAYACTIHPAMQGTVVVQAASGGVTHGDGTTTAPPTDTAPAATGRSEPGLPGPAALILLALAGLGGLGLGARRHALARARVPQVKR